MKKICYEYLLLDDITGEYILNVPTVGEESITDWLIWKWRKIDNKFKSIKLKSIPFNKKQEVLNGADLELWILTKTKAIPLLFQAKKAVADYDSYLQKLNYKSKGAKLKQYELLENHAKKEKLNPYYLIYSIYNNSSIFMLDIQYVKNLASLKKGTNISKKKLLSNSFEFYKLFCGDKKLIKELISTKYTISINELPDNIEKLLNSDERYKQTFFKAYNFRQSEFKNTEFNLNFIKTKSEVEKREIKIKILNNYPKKENSYIVRNLAIFDLRDSEFYE